MMLPRAAGGKLGAPMCWFGRRPPSGDRLAGPGWNELWAAAIERATV